MNYLYKDYTESEKEFCRLSNAKAEKKFCLFAEIYMSKTEILWGDSLPTCSVEKMIESVAVIDYKSLLAKLHSLTEEYIEGIFNNHPINISHIITQSEELFAELHPFFTLEFPNDNQWYSINYAKSYMEDELLYCLTKKFDNRITQDILQKYSAPLTGLMYSVEGEDLQIILTQQKKAAEPFQIETQSPYQQLYHLLNHFKTYLYIFAEISKNRSSLLHTGFLESFQQCLPERLSNMINRTRPFTFVATELMGMIEDDISDNKTDKAVEKITDWKYGLFGEAYFEYEGNLTDMIEEDISDNKMNKALKKGTNQKNKKPKSVCFEYRINYFEQLVYLYLKLIVEQHIKIRVCPCCKRIFLAYHKETFCPYPPTSSDVRPCNANDNYQQGLSDICTGFRRKISKRFDGQIQSQKSPQKAYYRILGKYKWQEKADEIISEYQKKGILSIPVSEPDPYVEAILEYYHSNRDDPQLQMSVQLESDLETAYQQIRSLIQNESELLVQWFQELPQNSKTKQDIIRQMKTSNCLPDNHNGET